MSEARLHEPAFQAVLGQLNRPGSRSLIPTPALLCDVDVLDRNIARMAEVCASAAVEMCIRDRTGTGG